MFNEIADAVTPWIEQAMIGVTICLILFGIALVVWQVVVRKAEIANEERRGRRLAAAREQQQAPR